MAEFVIFRVLKFPKVRYTTFQWHIYAVILALKITEIGLLLLNYRWWLGGILFWNSVVTHCATDRHASFLSSVIIPPPTVVAGGIIFYC